jgi:hypothetical protein
MTRAHRREDRHRIEERRPAPRPRYAEPEPFAVPPAPAVVNPYAVIALVAALLGLFPVAIVFGLIAFSHPGGRGKAVFALLLGLLEVAAIAGVVLTGHRAIDKIDSVLRSARTTTESATVTTTAVVPSAPVPAPAAAAPPVQYAGSYQRADGGTLKIADGSGGSENFDLSVQRTTAAGTPNFGSASGPLTVVNNKATYQSPYGSCQLVFQFAGGGVTITQNAAGPGDCGFGAGVQAGGQYLRK